RAPDARRRAGPRCPGPGCALSLGRVGLRGPAVTASRWRPDGKQRLTPLVDPDGAIQRAPGLGGESIVPAAKLRANTMATLLDKQALTGMRMRFLGWIGR